MLKSSEDSLPLHIPRLGKWWQDGYKRISLEKRTEFFRTFNLEDVDSSDLGYRYAVLELAERLKSQGVIDSTQWDLLVAIIAKKCDLLVARCSRFPSEWHSFHPGLNPVVAETISFYSSQRSAVRAELRSWISLRQTLSAIDNDLARQELLHTLVGS